jgi:DNA helicase-2/ATP-dependent DNA helicase PcrA
MDEHGQKGLEEERRLAYVGLTRAEKHCNISFVANRRVYNQWQSSLPSRFIENLAIESVEVLTPPGLNNKYFGYDSHDYDANSDRFDSINENSDKSSEFETTFNNYSSKYNSPGYSRMMSRTNQIRPTPLRNVSPKDIEVFDVDEKVFHQKFGYGYVTEVSENSVSVTFEKAGHKKVKANYLFNKGNLP